MDSTEHGKAIEAWRAAREHRLRTTDGWLTLVDRILLDPGDNALPFGVANLQGDVVQVRVQPGHTVTVGEQPVVERALRPREGVPSDVFVFEGRTYEIYRRGDAFAVRVKDPNAPALRAFSGLTYFPIDPAWRIVAAFERYQPPRTTVHALDVGASGPRQVPGLARFVAVGEGRPLALEPTLEEDTQRLFFVFADKTTGRETSPAGRFLYADLPGPDDTVILDFNRAFNPPCAFTPFATCPIPPPGNRLPVAIPAGEKDYPHI